MKNIGSFVADDKYDLCRTTLAYVGEDRILANTLYTLKRVNENELEVVR